MKKINKYIIAMCCIVLCLCSLVVPTFCSSVYVSNDYFTITSDYDTANNYYNLQNIQYVNLTNFNIEFNYGNGSAVANCIVYNSNVPSYVSYRLEEDVYIFAGQTKYKIGTIHITYVISVESDGYFAIYTSIEDNKFIPVDNVSIPLIPLNVDEFNVFKNFSISIPFLPYDYLKNNTNFFSLERLYFSTYMSYSLSFDIDYNNQYFYNDTFSIACQNLSPYITQQGTFENYTKTIQFTDNYNNLFSQNVSSGTVLNTSQLQVFTINNNYNYENCYYTNFKMIDKYSSYYLNSIPANLSNEDYYCYQHYFIGRNDISTGYNFYLISRNSKDLNNSFSSLIPLGSNEFYKDCEWWDISSHLYNFFVYLIFDAPIISNFTKLALVIISFIVDLFSFIISLFNGIENIFFISIFMGIFVLIFLLKIIFKE